MSGCEQARCEVCQGVRRCVRVRVSTEGGAIKVCQGVSREGCEKMCDGVSRAGGCEEMCQQGGCEKMCQGVSREGVRRCVMV